jgi:hypothetical protein
MRRYPNVAGCAGVYSFYNVVFEIESKMIITTEGFSSRGRVRYRSLARAGPPLAPRTLATLGESDRACIRRKSACKVTTQVQLRREKGKQTSQIYLIKKSITTNVQLGLYPCGPPRSTISSTSSMEWSRKHSTSPSCGTGAKSGGNSRSKQNNTSRL